MLKVAAVFTWNRSVKPVCLQTALLDRRTRKQSFRGKLRGRIKQLSDHSDAAKLLRDACHVAGTAQTDPSVHRS